MTKSIKKIRGMHDILPDENPLWNWLESQVTEVVTSYDYQQIRTPIIEKTELFKRSIGEVTDIVEKEMYTFIDRNGDSLTLRPEGTAGCVRAGIEHGLFYNQLIRLWYVGPMFRHERPQKGRYRQFYQIGAEAFGMHGPDIDAEIILLTARIWNKLGLKGIRLEINSLGNAESRKEYWKKLLNFLRENHHALDSDSQCRMESNPLRVLDSKNEETQKVLANAPLLIDGLDEQSRQHFEGLCEILSKIGIDFKINPRLVRGLDYYSHTVFEWITEDLGTQGTVCAGGRYDDLVEQLGGRSTPACGFAMGIERLQSLLDEQGLGPDKPTPIIYILSQDTAARQEALHLGEVLRGARRDLKVSVYCGESGLKAQMKRADRKGASVILIIGENELRTEQVTIREMYGSAEQITVAQTDLLTEVDKICPPS